MLGNRFVFSLADNYMIKIAVFSWRPKWHFYDKPEKITHSTTVKKVLKETQTLRAGGSTAEPKIFALP